MTELDPVMTKRVRRPTFLKEWRKHRKLTLEVASQRAGMTAGNLSAMERGAQGYTQAGLEALAQAYECEPGQLLVTDPDPTEEKPKRGPIADAVDTDAASLLSRDPSDLNQPDGTAIVPKQEIGLYLAEWREHRNLTQQQLADKLGSSSVTVSRWETRNRQPDLTAQKALAEALDIEVVDLHRHPDQPSADALLRGQPQEIVDLVLKLAVAVITPTNSTKGRQPRRPHFIPEWAERQNLIQKELANLSGADKGLVSKWYSGTTPGMEWQTKLAEVFGCDREGLFRHPDEDWLVRFFHDRTNDEVARMKSMLEAAFPSKRGQS